MRTGLADRGRVAANPSGRAGNGARLPALSSWLCPLLGRKMEFVERLDNRGSHDQPRKPLVVRRNHETRRVLRRCTLDHLLVGFLVILPEARSLTSAMENFQFFFGSSSRSRTASSALPSKCAGRIFESPPISSQVLFERVDVLVALFQICFVICSSGNFSALSRVGWTRTINTSS